MPDLPTVSGGPSETGSTPAGSSGVSFTCGTANAKAATWTEVIAATDYAATWLLVTLSEASAGGVGIGYLVDVGIGASTAEQVLVANLYFQSPVSTSVGVRTFLFPLRTPAGARLSVRGQCTTASATGRLTITAIASAIAAPPGLGRVETIGADTSDSNGVSVDCGGTAHTDVVGQLTAATGFAYRWMCLAVANPTDAAWLAAVDWLVDVCTGPSLSEVPVISDVYVYGGTGDDRPTPGAVCFPCAIAAGARVSVRARSSSITTGDRVLDVVAYGCG